MNYTRRKERARKRRAAIMVEVLGWMAVSIGVTLVGLVWYTFAVVVLGNG
jgi:FtsH-binding integral membrane protein